MGKPKVSSLASRRAVLRKRYAAALTTLRKHASPDADSLGPWALAADNIAGIALEASQRADRVGPDSAITALATAPAWLASWLELGRPLPRGAVSPLARAVAAGVWLAGAEGWNAGRVLRNKVRLDPSLLRDLRAAEAEHRALLRDTWQLARASKVDRVAPLARQLATFAAALPALLATAAAAPDEMQLDRELPGLRASLLLRRTALLAAALPLLAARVADPRLRATTADLARRRTRLERREGPTVPAARSLPPHTPETAVTIRGVLGDTQWIERPEKPYEWARTQSGVVLVLPHKRFRTRGALRGSVVWAAGRVKPDFADLGRVLEIEGEGPGQHAATVWADWLAEQLRRVIDIAPGSVRLYWELPDPRERGSGRDIVAHLGRGEVA